NLAQFSLLVGINALVGGMVGQERTVLPLLATRTFGLAAFTATTTFIVAFGATKALTNLATGALTDRVGRKPVPVAGWLLGLPAPPGLRPHPLYRGTACAGLGLGLSPLFVRAPHGHARHDATPTTAQTDAGGRFGVVFARAAWRDPTLSAVSQAGLVNNAVDGLAWGILPLLFAAGGLSVDAIGVLAAIYPAVWCVGQLITASRPPRRG